MLGRLWRETKDIAEYCKLLCIVALILLICFLLHHTVGRVERWKGEYSLD